MRHLLGAALTGLLLTSSLPALAQAPSWSIDAAHSSAQFSVRHMMISNVRGEFGKVSGTIVYDAADPKKSSIDAVIDVASINTRVEKRDEHLRSPDFFDVAKFPTMTFKSKKVDVAGKGKLRVTGDLTLHGVTRPVTLDVQGPSPVIKDPMGNQRSAASATTKISRKDFGLTWNKALEAGGLMVGDEVSITLDVEFIRPPAAPAP